MKPFFIEIPNFLGLGRQFGQINFGAFGVSSANLSAPILIMFSINQPLFLQKVSLYIQIPNIYLGLGFEFGPQRIRDLAIVCKQSVIISSKQQQAYFYTKGNITIQFPKDQKWLPKFCSSQHRERCQYWSTEINSKQIVKSIVALQILNLLIFTV